MASVGRVERLLEKADQCLQKGEVDECRQLCMTILREISLEGSYLLADAYVQFAMAAEEPQLAKSYLQQALKLAQTEVNVGILMIEKLKMRLKSMEGQLLELETGEEEWEMTDGVERQREGGEVERFEEDTGKEEGEYDGEADAEWEYNDEADAGGDDDDEIEVGVENDHEDEDKDIDQDVESFYHGESDDDEEVEEADTGRRRRYRIPRTGVAEVKGMLE
ncbi:MAG: hypothetical protein M1818_000094 [Claussenomyces sp. TS43310]|nr:MAG: hypothetical protein M1818_000094 [Claussenomyces sp. TS43310]